jgi:hypothetical protein
VANERRDVLKEFDIRAGEPNLDTRLVASCLLRGTPRKNTDRLVAKTLEDVSNGLAKTAAIRR